MPYWVSYSRGRRERRVLSDILASPRSELMLVYGRLGFGNSALIHQGLADSGLPHISYRATRSTLPQQMAALTEATQKSFPEAFPAQPFVSFGLFLEFLSHQAAEREASGHPAPVVVVIDELPFLADAEPGLLTVLQHWWDANQHRPNLKLFFAGSYLDFQALRGGTSRVGRRRPR